MIKMEEIIMGLLLLNVLLLLIILWRTEVSVYILKRQVKISGEKKETEKNKIVPDSQEVNNKQSDGLLCESQGTEIVKLETGKNIMEEIERQAVEIVSNESQIVVKNTDKAQENEDLINEVLSEIFS